MLALVVLLVGNCVYLLSMLTSKGFADGVMKFVVDLSNYAPEWLVATFGLLAFLGPIVSIPAIICLIGDRLPESPKLLEQDAPPMMYDHSKARTATMVSWVFSTLGWIVYIFVKANQAGR